MIIVAHEDDSLLFFSPDLIRAIQNGQCVRTVFVTAGDDGRGQSYWSSRESGAEAAYSQMAAAANTWQQSDAGVAGHPIPVMTLSADPNISLVFMRLPDGNLDGSGFASQGFESLQKLYTDAIPQITADDGSSSYTLGTLTSTLSSLVESFKPNAIWTQDYAGSYGDGDHSDHHTVAYLTRDVSRAWTTTTHTLTGYMDYATQGQPANVTGSDFTAKEKAWFSYTPFDSQVCQDATSCQQTSYWGWLNAQYTVGTETDGLGQSDPPVASAGPNQTVLGGAAVQLDGSASSDPGGSPSYAWTQTGGPAITLSDPTSVQPTFTAPTTASTLTFQLVVTDGSQSSDPATVTITTQVPTPSASGAPSISGEAVEGQALSESHASWSGSPTSYSYQWQSCDGSGTNCSAIAGATGQSYTLTANDVEHTIRVQETATNAGGSSSPAVSTATATVLAAVPSTSGAPSISGSAVEGQTLSESHASWSGSPTSYSYQWQSCDGSGTNCSAIAGATGQSYTLTSAEIRDTIRVQETATNAGGSSSPAVSTATATVLAAVPSTSGAPSISGSAVEGQALSESHASWSGSPTSYSYQWQSCDGSGTNCSAIAGATGQSYTLTSAEIGDTIRVQETATNGGGSSDPAISAQTSAVQAQHSDGGGPTVGGGGGTGVTTGDSGSGGTGGGPSGSSSSGTGGSPTGPSGGGPARAVPTFGRVKATATGVRLSVACRGSSGSSCTFVLRLTVNGKGTRVLGSLSVRLAAGHRKTVTIRLNRTAKRLLNQQRKPTAKFTVIQNRATILQKVITFKRTEPWLTPRSRRRHR